MGLIDFGGYGASLVFIVLGILCSLLKDEQKVDDFQIHSLLTFEGGCFL